MFADLKPNFLSIEKKTYEKKIWSLRGGRGRRAKICEIYNTHPRLKVCSCLLGAQA